GLLELPARLHAAGPGADRDLVAAERRSAAQPHDRPLGSRVAPDQPVRLRYVDPSLHAGRLRRRREASCNPRRATRSSMNEAPMEHVAVTGMGIVTPIGSTTGIFWQQLLAGKRALAPIHGAVKLSGNRLWAAVPNVFSCDGVLTPFVARNTDRFTQYALAATKEAVDQARLDPPADRTAVIVG